MIKRLRVLSLWISFFISLCLVTWLSLAFVLCINYATFNYKIQVSPFLRDVTQHFVDFFQGQAGLSLANSMYMGLMAMAVAISLWLSYVVSYYLRLNRVKFRYHQPQLIKYLAISFGTIFALCFLLPIVAIAIFYFGMWIVILVVAIGAALYAVAHNLLFLM